MRNEKGQFIKGHNTPHSQKTKDKIAETCRKKGIGKWMQGRKLSEKTKERIKKNNSHYWLGKERLDISKGDNAKERAIHAWVAKHKGKATEYKCEYCSKQAHDWANIKSHIYKKNLDDYIPLCRSCHKKWDLSKKIK